MAGNPYTIEPATGLSSDPTYNPTDKLPNWLKRRIERQKRLQEIYNRIPWYAKVIVGTVLLAASIALTLVSRTGGAGVASIFIQLALGIGIGVGTYLASSLLTDTFTPEGLLNTVLDTFVITAAVIFISASINYIKYLTRSRPVTAGELAGNDIVGTKHNLLKPTQDYVSKDKVAEYIGRISTGEKLKPINVANTTKGKFILDGHHRYVASQMTGTKIDIIIQEGGPIGFADWTFVNWI